MATGRSELVLRGFRRLFGVGTTSGVGAGRLLERFAVEGDGAAFEALVTRHGPMVLGTCRRILSDPHDVEDAFQATFLVLARKAGSIEDADRLGPWLHGVARRVAARSRALAYRRNAREHPLDDEPAAESPDFLERSEIHAGLDDELAKLPEKYRAPLVLCYLEGLTHDEAADALRWPVGTVRSRLASGRDRLRIRLTRRGLHPSAAVPGLLAKGAMPAALLARTVRVATTAGSAPVHVLNLAKGALIAMGWNKLKMVAALGLMTGLTVGGAGVAAQQGGAGTPVITPATGPAEKAKRDWLEEVAEALRERINRDRLDAMTKKVKAIEDSIPAAATQFENLKRERDRGLLEVAALKKKLGIDQPPDAPTPESSLDAAGFEEEMKRLRAEESAIERQIKNLRAEHDKALRPLEKALDDLNTRDFHLGERWKKLKTDTASTAVDDRIKRLEKQIDDQAEVIRGLQGRGKASSLTPTTSAPVAPTDPTPSPGPRPVANDAEPKSSPAGPPVASDRSGPGSGPASDGSGMGGGLGIKAKGLSATYVVNLGVTPALYATIASEEGRITMIDPKSNRKATYRLPEGMSPSTNINPSSVGGNLFPLAMIGPKVTQLAVFDRQAWRWVTLDLGGSISSARPIIGPAGSALIGFTLGGPEITRLVAFSASTRDWVTQDLKEPTSRHLAPTLYSDVFACPVGRYFYAYSDPAQKWATLELKRPIVWNQSGETFSPRGGKIVIPEEDVIHVYDVKTGEWTHSDASDEPAK